MLYLEEPGEREKLGFGKYDSIVGYAKKSKAEWQQINNKMLTILEGQVPESERMDTAPVTYQILGGEDYAIPQWFTNIQGHQLVTYLRQAAPFLNRYGDDKKLFKKIITLSYGNYLEIIPMDVVETLRKIQEA